jgi:hypothetical protein
MKVLLDSEILAGGTSEREHSSAYDIVITGEIQTSVRDGVRRAISGVRDRGNLKTIISFSTTRKFASVAEAETFCLGYDATANREGTLTTDTGFSMINTVVLPPERRINGVSVTLRYTCIGGGLESGTP